MDDLIIRPATAADAAAIDDIYSHYVRTSISTFQIAEGTLEDRHRWLEAHDDRHPVLIAERGGRAVGWGSLSQWGQREAWRNTVEVSVWIADGETGNGVGPRLLDALIEEGRRIGHHALIAQISATNQPSLKMSERAGFERVGTLKEVGHKFDTWIDIALFELVI